MRACTHCFVSPTWVANASPAEPSPGNCDFGHDYQTLTWPTTAWIDSLTQLAQLYEISDPSDPGLTLSAHVQADWQVFSFTDSEVVHSFLASAIGESHELLSADALVNLKSVADDDGSNAITDWEEFSAEIRTRNRYFPQTVPDRRVLERVLLEHVQTVQPDVELFRARSVDTGLPPSQDRMGAPPSSKANGGRANPTGIPYLYLAFSKQTCVYESRAGNHAQLAIGTFKPNRDLRVLNLADIDPPDFFSVEDIGAVEEQVRRISSYRYLVALGEELSKPIRSSDLAIDYIPTQYLCELAKSLEMDGVLYSSAQHNEGRNLVLFDVDAATCAPQVELVQITSLEAQWESLPV